MGELRPMGEPYPEGHPLFPDACPKCGQPLAPGGWKRLRVVGLNYHPHYGICPVIEQENVRTTEQDRLVEFQRMKREQAGLPDNFTMTLFDCAAAYDKPYPAAVMGVMTLRHAVLVAEGGNPPQGCTVVGEPGSGKTTLVQALLLDLAERGCDVRIEHVPSVQEKLWHSHGQDREDLLFGLVSRLRRSQVVVLDDFGMEQIHPAWLDGFVYPLLWWRVNKGLPTLLTVIEPFEWFCNEYSRAARADGRQSSSFKPLLDRLRTSCPWVSLPGGSRRRYNLGTATR